ncbi:MAG: T9SS type A sorting domain-containing protein [Bacteroidota bacterium]
MKWKELLAIFMCCIGLHVSGQIYFQKNIGTGFAGEAHSVCLSTDQRYVAACAGSLYKIDSSGYVVWVKKYLSPLMYSNSFVIRQSSGGYMMIFEIKSGGFGLNDMMVFSTDSSGAIDWIRTFGGVGTDVPGSIVECGNGDFVLAGQSDALNGSQVDVLLMRFNKYGNQFWQRSYGSASDDDDAEKILVTQTGDLLVGGRMWSQISLLKTDANGVERWCKTYGMGSLFDLIEDKQTGDFYACGTTEPDNSKSQRNAFVMKTDSAGTVVWAKVVGNNVDATAYSITADSAFTQLVVSGEIANDTLSNSKAFTCAMNPANGALIWNKHYGQATRDVFYDAMITDDAMLVQVGYSATSDTLLRNVFVVKTPLTGESDCGVEDVVSSVDSLLSLQAIDFAYLQDSGEIFVMTKCFPPSWITFYEHTYCTNGKAAIASENQLGLHPNPSTGSIRVDFALTDTKTIEIFNATGRLVYKQNYGHVSGAEIDLSGKPAGVYLVVVKTEKVCYKQKVVIE